MVDVMKYFKGVANKAAVLNLGTRTTSWQDLLSVLTWVNESKAVYSYGMNECDEYKLDYINTQSKCVDV